MFQRLVTLKSLCLEVYIRFCCSVGKAWWGFLFAVAAVREPDSHGDKS